MTLAAVAANQIQASQAKLLAPNVLASYLLEDTNLQLDKQSIEPLHESRMRINSASGVVELEVLTDISMSNSFCSLTAKRLEEKARNIIGHSPDIVDDILNPIIKAIEDLIEFVISPIGDVVDRIKRMVYDSAVLMQNKIAGAITTIKNGITTVIETSQGVVTDAVGFVEGQVTALLDSVVDFVSQILLKLEQVFDKIGNVFKDLLTMEPSDIVNLQMELTKLAGEAMMKGAKD